MNYVEIIARQEEIQAELVTLQEQRIASAQGHESFNTESEVDGTTVALSLDYDGRSDKIITVSAGDQSVSLSVEDYNMVSQFLSKYNDAIFSYMSEITGANDAAAPADAGEEA